MWLHRFDDDATNRLGASVHTLTRKRNSNAGQRQSENFESIIVSSVSEDPASTSLLPLLSIAGFFEDANIGALLLHHGTIRSTNQVARTILGHGDGLCVNNGSLTAQFPTDDRSLQNLIAAVLSPNRRAAGGGLLVVRRPARLPLAVQLHPMTVHSGADRATPFPAALVLIRDPELIPPVDRKYVAAVLGLSSVESRVAVLLSRGRSVREIASAIHRSEHTVRWTLKNVYAKTRCTGQVGLVRLIGRLTGDIPPPRGGQKRWTGAQAPATGKLAPRE